MSRRKKNKYSVKRGFENIHHQCFKLKEIIRLGDADQDMLKFLLHKDVETMKKYIDGPYDKNYDYKQYDNKPEAALPVAPETEAK